MKTKIVILLLLLSNFSFFSQKKTIKNILEIKMDKVYDEAGKVYNYASEKNEYQYNLKGKITKEIRKTFYNHQLLNKITTEYYRNENGVITGDSTFLSEDSIAYKTNYVYKEDRLVQKNAFYSLSNKTIKYKQDYYYKKNKIQKSVYAYTEQYPEIDFPSRNLFAEFYYNKKGKLIESNWLKSDNSYKHNRILHKRNRKGHTISEKEYDKKGEIVKTTKFTYKLDSQKNWIEKNIFENKKLTRTIYRKIAYYN